jgi:hypothetical protein
MEREGMVDAADPYAAMLHGFACSTALARLEQSWRNEGGMLHPDLAAKVQKWAGFPVHHRHLVQTDAAVHQRRSISTPKRSRNGANSAFSASIS